jgi:hypothetical protein
MSDITGYDVESYRCWECGTGNWLGEAQEMYGDAPPEAGNMEDGKPTLEEEVAKLKEQNRVLQTSLKFHDNPDKVVLDPDYFREVVSEPTDAAQQLWHSLHWCVTVMNEKDTSSLGRMEFEDALNDAEELLKALERYK